MTICPVLFCSIITVALKSCEEVDISVGHVFRKSVHFVNPSGCDPDPGHPLLEVSTRNEVVIKSPNYPDLYPVDQEWVWDIQVLEPGYWLAVEVVDFVVS